MNGFWRWSEEFFDDDSSSCFGCCGILVIASIIYILTHWSQFLALWK